jgi:phage tail-like protein
MAADTGKTEDAIWPLPVFSFQVTWGTQQKIPFQEVSGMDAETQVIEYRHSNSKAYSTIKMPGIAKYGNVTFKKGIFVKDNTFWTWYSGITMNTYDRVSIIIQLLDENQGTTMTWTLLNAWPTKVSGPTLKSDGNEVAIETIEVAHEGLTIANGGS